MASISPVEFKIEFKKLTEEQIEGAIEFIAEENKQRLGRVEKMAVERAREIISMLSRERQEELFKWMYDALELRRF